MTDQEEIVYLGGRIARLEAAVQALEDNAMQYRRMIGDLEQKLRERDEGHGRMISAMTDDYHPEENQ